MIVFDLACEDNHRFEGWFKSNDDFAEQMDSGLLTCPVCGSEHIVKIPSPSRLNLKNHSQLPSEFGAGAAQHRVSESDIERLHQFVENNFENVGEDFTQEARDIHHGEADSRNIYGTATLKDMLELHEERQSVIYFSGLSHKPANRD